jgi:putative NADH-flavin reductase
MKILIFGSTGSVGRQLVRQGLEQEHSVTAFSRSPAKLDLQHSNLAMIQGDVTDPGSVAEAVKGQDAVLCVLGSGKKRQGTVRSEGTKHIVSAMETLGVQRLICQTTLGAGDSQGNLNFFWKYIMFGMILQDVFLDHERQENYVRQSQLDWTLVRPGAFTDGPLTGRYRHGFSGQDRTTKLKISRADVANFMLKQLTDRSYSRKSPGISY